METETDHAWSELSTTAERYGPTYDQQYGVWPFCKLGPSMMVPLSNVSWAICGFCFVRWPVGADLFDIPLAPDEEGYEEAYKVCFDLLAEAEAAPDDREG